MVRREKDSMGEVEVPDERLYGAQTARSLKFFEIGGHRMPEEVIEALLWIKKCAAETNVKLGVLSKESGDLIIKAVDSLLKNRMREDFPLSVWQTGSGTQTNMNVNEVIANLATKKLHPNDHVNKSQSSNDVFPSAMHIATVLLWKNQLIPHVKRLRNALEQKKQSFANIVKIGRTHLMDAVPMTLGQEFSALVNQLDQDIDRLEYSLSSVYELPLGGTAVGTGLNAPKDFGPKAIERLSRYLKEPFVPADNRFASLASHDAIVFAHGALKTLACSLFKIASDIRLLASGPKSGFGELILPANEPGSSIMPGKVNPTQCEAMTMVCVQVFGNDTAITFAGSLGQFQLNVFKPLMIYNMIESTKIVSDVCKSFTDHLVEGLKANEVVIQRHLENSLMLVTALAPQIGYDKAAEIAKKALDEDITLRQAALKSGYLTLEEFDRLINFTLKDGVHGETRF